MTTEARLAFLVVFFLMWSSLGTLAWAAAAVRVRGRGALFAFPLALAGAAAFGILVPLVGPDNAFGFFLSLVAAFIGGALGSWAGIVLSRRIDAAKTTTPPAAEQVTSGASEPASDTLDS